MRWNSLTKNIWNGSYFVNHKKIRGQIFKSTVCYKFIFFSILLVSCKSLTTVKDQIVQTPNLVQVTSTQRKVSITPLITPTTAHLPTTTVLPIFTPKPPMVTPIPCPPFKMDIERPDPDVPENYIGRHYDTRNLPKGLGEIGGSLIQKNNDIEYSLTKLMWTSNRMMWWLEKLVCRDNNGRAYFEVVDAIASPPLNDHDTVADICFSDGSNEGSSIVMAVGIYDKNSSDVVNGYVGYIFNEIKFAMQLDFNTMKFKQINTEGLTCLMQFGLGPEP